MKILNQQGITDQDGNFNMLSWHTDAESNPSIYWTPKEEWEKDRFGRYYKLIYNGTANRNVRTFAIQAK